LNNTEIEEIKEKLLKLLKQE